MFTFNIGASFSFVLILFLLVPLWYGIFGELTEENKNKTTTNKTAQHSWERNVGGEKEHEKRSWDTNVRGERGDAPGIGAEIPLQ